MPDIEMETVRRKVPQPGQGRDVCDIAVLAVGLLLIWSGLFLSTYHYPFYWDDFHQIRPYSWDELLWTLHGSYRIFVPPLDQTPSHPPSFFNVRVRCSSRVHARRNLRFAVCTAACLVAIAASMESLAPHVSSCARRPRSSGGSPCIATYIRAGGTIPGLHHPQIDNALNFDKIILGPRGGYDHRIC